MKINIFLAAILTLLSLYSGINAQNTYEPIYLEADSLFMNIISQEYRYGKPIELANTGRIIQAEIDNKQNRHLFAAQLILDIQKFPTSYAKKGQEKQNASESRRSLEADVLMIEYIKALAGLSISYNKYSDPLGDYIGNLDSEEGRSILREDLDKRLGEGIAREETMAKIIKDMKTEYRAARLDQIRDAILRGSSAVLPYPLCLLNKKCPRVVGTSGY